MNKYKVNLSKVKEYCSMTPYIRLVNQEIRNGEGFVSIYGTPENGKANIYAHDTYSYLFGGVYVPLNALEPVEAVQYA